MTSIAAVLAMVAAGAVLTAPAAAAATETHYHPDGVEYTYDPGNPAAGATASGCSGACPDPMYILDSFHDGSETYQVVAIGDSAFKEEGLTEVSTGDNVEKIGGWAFSKNKITDLILGSNVEVIESYAFSDNSLKSVEIPGSVTTIGIHTFLDNRLTSVKIPDSVTAMGLGAFQSNKLTSVTIGDSVTNIRNFTFSKNELTSVTIPDLVTIVNKGAFADNSGLTSVVFTGSAPTVTVASDSYPSFDTSSGKLVLTYPWQYRASYRYPSTIWEGYSTFTQEPSSPPSPTACPPGPFSDVDASNTFCEDIAWLSTSGVTDGYADGTFLPAANVTRQAMAAFLYRFDNPGQPKPACTGSSPFKDIATNKFCGEIEWMNSEGLSNPYPDGGFHPATPVTRHAIAAQLYRFDNPGQPKPACTGSSPFNDIAADNFCGEIEWMNSEGLSKPYDDGGFHPAAPMSRQAMAAFLHRVDTYLP